MKAVVHSLLSCLLQLVVFALKAQKILVIRAGLLELCLAGLVHVQVELVDSLELSEHEFAIALHLADLRLELLNLQLLLVDDKV